MNQFSAINIFPLIAMAKMVVCDRCGLKYRGWNKNCTNCSDLSSLQLFILKRESLRQRVVSRILAAVFILVGVVFAFTMLANVL